MPPVRCQQGQVRGKRADDCRSPMPRMGFNQRSSCAQWPRSHGTHASERCPKEVDHRHLPPHPTPHLAHSHAPTPHLAHSPCTHSPPRTLPMHTRTHAASGIGPGVVLSVWNPDKSWEREDMLRVTMTMGPATPVGGGPCALPAAFWAVPCRAWVGEGWELGWLCSSWH
jgi:hypothetical protein